MKKYYFIYLFLSYLIVLSGCLHHDRELDTELLQPQTSTEKKITITGRIDLANVGLHQSLGGYYPSIARSVLDYSHFIVFVEDNENLSSFVSSDGFFKIENVPAEKIITIKAKSKKYPGLVLEWSGYKSDKFIQDIDVNVSIFSTARSVIFQIMKNYYGFVVEPQKISQNDISNIVDFMATVLEKFHNKISDEVPLTQLPEIIIYANDVAKKIISADVTQKINDWTIMVYQIGDENLKWALKKKFNEILRVGTYKNIIIIVQTNAISPTSEIERYIISENTVKKAKVQWVQSGNKVADPKLLQEFVSWCIRRYPAPNFALILSSYGGGVKLPITNLPLESIQQGYGDIIEYSKALIGGLKVSNSNILFRKLALLFFDASMMGMFEIAYQFRDCANYIAFSQGSFPAIGLPYYEIFSYINNKTFRGSDKLGFEYNDPRDEAFIINSFGKLYHEYYEKNNLSKNYSGTISIVKCSELEKLMESFAKWVDNIYQKFQNYCDIINSILQAKITDEYETISTNKFYVKAVDFVDYKDLLDLVIKIREQIPQTSFTADEFVQQYNKSIIYNAYFGKRYKNCNGMSIALPTKHSIEDYFSSNFSTYRSYCEFDLCKFTFWDELIRKLAEVQLNIPLVKKVYGRGLSIEINWTKQKLDLDLDIAEPNVNFLQWFNIGQTPISSNGYFSVDSAVLDNNEEHWKAKFRVVGGKYYVRIVSKVDEVANVYNDYVSIRIKTLNNLIQRTYEVRKIYNKKIFEIEFSEEDVKITELQSENTKDEL